jgi:hypothetical protein
VYAGLSRPGIPPSVNFKTRVTKVILMEVLQDSYKQIDEKLCATTEEICSKLEISRKTLSEWESKGCPKAARGWWPVWELLKWKGHVGSAGQLDEDNSYAVKKLKYEAEYRKQKAEEATFGNSVIRGEYISKADATGELQRFFVVLKRSLLAISRKLSSEVGNYVDPITARRIEKMVTELILDALGQLSIDGIYTATKKKKEKD